MSFFVLNRLVSLHLLFQFAIFLAVPFQSYSVTYHASSVEVNGNEVENECTITGGAPARIYSSASLIKAQKALNESDKEEYWTALRYHKKHNYCWKVKDDECQVSIDEPDIVDTAGKNTWTKGWYCFYFSLKANKLQADKCSNNIHRYVCEQDIPSSETSSMHTNSASMKPVTLVTKTTAAPMSTIDIPSPELSSMHTNSASMKPVTIVTKTKAAPMSTIDIPSSELSSMQTNSASMKPVTKTTTTTAPLQAPTAVVTTSTLPKLTTQMITTQVTPSTVITTSVTTTPLLTGTLTSNLRTTEEISVKQTLTTAGSSLTATANNETTTQEKLSAKKKLRRYVSAISALNVREETALQDAANTTNSLLKSLEENEYQNKDINVLLATQELENFAISYGKIHIKANESKVVSKELFAMKIQKVPADQETPIVFSIDETDHSSKESSAGISLPPKIFKGQDTMVISIVYNDIKQWAPDPKNDELDGTKFNKLEMGSRIIATTIDPKPNGTLEENVTISFSQDEEVNKGKTPHCVFWDFTIKSDLNGSWASTGCSMIQQVDGKITCSCNHLTNFAVLMQVGEGNVGKISADHKKALEIITYIGCGLSLAGELLTVIAYFALMNVKQEQLQIRLNLVVAIAIAQIVFLSGIDASESKGACVFVAAMIHYFYLVGFAWMLFEGVYLYLMVVKVFNTVIRMRLFYAFAWGFPLAMVVLSLIIASGQDGGVNSYVHGDFCWVSFKNNLIWTFAAPVLVVCVINATILARVLYEIMRMQSDKTSELEKIRQGLKALAVLFPLLGLTWLFGLLAVTDAGLAFQYIFTILNSLQGFFIFVIHILRNSDVRAAFVRKKQKWTDSRNISSSRVTSHINTDMWPSKLTSEHSQDSQAEISPRKSHKPRASASGYENMNMVPQERNLTPVQM